MATSNATARIIPGEITTIDLSLFTTGALAVIKRLSGIHFEFDKSFVEPCAKAALRDIADYAATRPDSTLLLVGHTDRAGSNSYNEALSQRRAKAIYAYVTFDQNPDRSVDAWQELRADSHEQWGAREQQYMLQYLGYWPLPVGTDDPQELEDAVRAFQYDYQEQEGLTEAQFPVDGRVGDKTWAALFREYITADGAAIPEAKFLEGNVGLAKVDDYRGRHWIGCGETRLLYNSTGPERDRRNRRVEFLFFREPGVAPNPPTCGLYDSLATLTDLGVPFTVRGTLTYLCNQPLDGEDLILVNSLGEEIPRTTDDQGHFEAEDQIEGVFAVEVPTRGLRIVCDDLERPIQYSRVCRRLTMLDDRLDVRVATEIENFVLVQDTRLTAGGQELCFFGTNAYYLMQEMARWKFARNEPAHQQVRDAFCLFERACLPVVRTWAFNESPGSAEIYTRTQTAAGAWGRGLDALERLIREATQRGIYLILALCDYWHSYGGMSRYADWAGYKTSLANGDPDHLVEELFYTGSITSDPAAAARVRLDPRTLYRAFACHVINRFRDEPAILAWELMNEPRARATGSASAARRTQLRDNMRTWIGETARFIKDNCAPQQLLAIGGVEIEDLEFVFDDATVHSSIDLVDTHIYPTHGEGFDRTTRACQRIHVRYTPDGARQALRQAADLAINQIGKPFYLGEYGVGYYPSTSIDASPNTPAEDKARARLWLDRAQQFRWWSDILRGHGCSGMLFWQLLPQSRTAYDPNEIQVSPTDSTTDPLQGVYPDDAAQIAAFVNQSLPVWRGCQPAPTRLELSVSGATRVGEPGRNEFAVSRAAGRQVTVQAAVTPPSAATAGITWSGDGTGTQPDRRQVAADAVGNFTVTAALGGVSATVVIHVREMQVDRYAQTAPANAIFDTLSNAHEPVLRLCDTDTARLRVEVSPNDLQVFYTSEPTSVVQLNPQQRTGDGEIEILPQALPPGTDVPRGRETRLSVRGLELLGPPLAYSNHPAQVRLRQFQRITAWIYLHVVRDDGGSLHGMSMTDLISNVNAGLDAANRIWGQACIGFRLRQAAGTTGKTHGYVEADLDLDYIDETNLLDITATYSPAAGVTFPTNEDDDLYQHNMPAGHNRNTDNPTFINVYLIDQFVGAGTLGGVAGGNHLIIERGGVGNNTLFAHELGHCLGLRDLERRGITDHLDRRLMRSGSPRGELLASGGVVGDETYEARQRSVSFTG